MYALRSSSSTCSLVGWAGRAGFGVCSSFVGEEREHRVYRVVEAERRKEGLLMTSFGKERIREEEDRKRSRRGRMLELERR
jgi:hypothetical protein